MVDKKTLLKNLQADYEASKNAKTILENNIVKWKKYYNGDPLGNEVKGKSKYVSKDIKKLLKWQLPIILEPFVNTAEIVRCQGTVAETVHTSKKIENLLNYQFTRQFDRYNFLRKSIKLLQKESKVVVRTGWKLKTETQQVLTPEGMQTIEVPVVNQPDAIICKNENIFIDPKADGETPTFVVHKYETTISNLRENKHWFNQKAVEELAKTHKDNDNDETALAYERETTNLEHGGDYDYESSDKSLKKVVVYEYWGQYDIDEDGIAEQIVCAWSDNVILKLEDNPYPDNEIPFVFCDFDADPFQNYSDSAIEDLVDNSHLMTLIKRGLIENLASANIGQKGIAKGALDTINLRKFRNGEDFEYNKNFGEPWTAHYNPLGNTPLEMLQMLETDNEALSGVTKNAIGERTPNLSATQAGQIESATQRRMLDLVRNIAENLVKPILRKWLVYDMQYLSDRELIYITGSDEPVFIDKKDLDGRVHMQMQVTTQAIDEQKAKQLAFLLQTSQQSQDPKITKMLYVKMLKLNKMFEEAKELENYEPQPNMQQQQTMQLELAKLQAEVQNLKVKALENQADIQLKLARAKEIASKADLNDLDYVGKATGEHH